MPFLDRAEACCWLAGLLTGERGTGTVVLGLPRGGVPVAYEIARALGAPLDVILVRKIGLPAQPELAMGAIGEDGVRVVNDDVVLAERVSDQQFGGVEERERAELARRADRYRAGRPRLPLTGKNAIVVDDGIATGSTARAACQVARAHGAARVVLAVPVAPRASIGALASVADEVVCAEVPEPFLAIGQWYQDFAQTSDEEVVNLLRRAGESQPDGVKPGEEDQAAADRDVIVMAGRVPLPGRLTVPAGARGVVVFAHGSGSSRSSPRNMFVAGALHVVGLGSLLFDLLTPEEEADRANVFDIGLLAWPVCGHHLAAGAARAGAGPGRLLRRQHGCGRGAAGRRRPGSPRRGWRDLGRGLPRRPSRPGRCLAGRGPGPHAVAGRRAGRPGARAERVGPGAADRGEPLVVIPGAGHLFAEPGTLEQVASLARDWFLRYLREDRPPAR